MTNTNPAPDMAVEAKISELMSLAAEWKRLPGCTGASVDAQDALRDALRAALARPQEVAWEEMRQKYLDRLQDIIDAKMVMREAGMAESDFPTMFKEFAASRAPVAVGVEPENCRTCGESRPFTGTCGTSDSDTQALCKRPSAGAGGSVGAEPAEKALPQHFATICDDGHWLLNLRGPHGHNHVNAGWPSKKVYTEEQVRQLLATPAPSVPLGGGEVAGYTDAQLAAGVTALELCRSRGIPLSDETVAGIVYDHMTAAAPQRPLTIYLDEEPIDVAQFYRAKDFEKLPKTPTMSGAEIRACGWKKNDYPMFIDFGNTGKPFEPVGDANAVPLVHGMRFVCIPPAYATPGLEVAHPLQAQDAAPVSAPVAFEVWTESLRAMLFYAVEWRKAGNGNGFDQKHIDLARRLLDSASVADPVPAGVQGDAARPLKEVDSAELRLELHLRSGPQYQCQSPTCRSYEDKPGKWDTCPSCGLKGFLCGSFVLNKESDQYQQWEKRTFETHRAAAQSTKKA